MAEPDEGAEEEEAEEGEPTAACSPAKKKRRYMPLTSPHKAAVKKTEVEAVVLSGPQKARSTLAKVREEKKKALEAKKGLVAVNKALKKELADARVQFRKERHRSPGDPLAQAWKEADDVQKGPAREAAKQLIILKWQEAKDPNRHDKEGAWKCV